VRALVLVLACVSGACRAAQDATALPDGFELVFNETFDDARALDAFAFSDPEAWTWHAGGALELAGASDYTPPHRSPLSIALIGTEVGDFVLEADLMQTGREYGHRDLCLFFGFEGPARYHYVHLATTPDERAHNVFVVHDEDRRPLLPVAQHGIEWGTDVWRRVRLERRGATVRVFFDDLQAALFVVTDVTHAAGRVGFGSFDDQGRIDNVRLWSNASPRPTAADPFVRR